MAAPTPVVVASNSVATAPPPALTLPASATYPQQATASPNPTPAQTVPAPHTASIGTSPSKLNFPLRATTTAHTAAHPTHATPGTDAGSIGGAVLSLLLVVGLILGLGWLAKRLPGMQRGAGTSQLKVVASVALGPRERAVVIDVAGTQLLLGVGAGGVRTLHTLEHPLAVSESAGPSPFAQVLAQHFGRKP